MCIETATICKMPKL